MSKPPRRRPASQAETPQSDPRRETPGSYERQEDGAYVRTDEPQGAAQSATPEIPLASARSIAAALTEAGAETPPHIQAALDAADGPQPPVTQPEGGDDELGEDAQTQSPTTGDAQSPTE